MSRVKTIRLTEKSLTIFREAFNFLTYVFCFDLQKVN